MRIFATASAALIFGLTTALGGCGNGAPAESGKASSEPRGVITSSVDCVSFGPNVLDACTNALAKAVDAHETSAPTFTNLKACETAVGANNCERSAAGKYRPRLLAFAVTVAGTSARAEPLYAVKDGAVGFQTAGKSVLLATDVGVAFSRQALSVAEMQAGSGKKGFKAPKL